jgi:Tfp pilus assembly major pilin PilA
VIGFIVAIAIPKVLGYFKKNNVRGFMIHMAYWYGVIEAKNLFASNAFERFWVK